MWLCDPGHSTDLSGLFLLLVEWVLAAMHACVVHGLPTALASLIAEHGL